MKEKRKYERFDLRLSGKIVADGSGHGEVLDVVTHDVSAGGAHFHTTRPMAEGAQLNLVLTVTSKKLQELSSAQGLLKAEGAVVRCTVEGTAICFSGEPEVVPIAVS